MSQATAQKLKIKEGTTVLVKNAPVGYRKSLGPLPGGVKITVGEIFDQVHWFVREETQMEKELEKVLSWIKGEILCWIFYPKVSSKIQTDLNRDAVSAILQKQGIQMINLISFDDNWSAFGIRQKSEANKNKEVKTTQRAIFDYIDPGTKTVKLPEDFAAALKKNKEQQAFFNTLSFTNKKEYIEWIVTAKKDETRDQRVKGSMERLGKEWKNPSNR